MNEDPIPFRNKSHNGASAGDEHMDDAVEVKLEEESPGPSGGRPTGRLDPASLVGAAGAMATLPLQVLPSETRQHLRNAGREASLALAELGAGVLKGLAIVFNVAGESLKSYSERQGKVTDLGSERSRRRKVDIEVE